MQFTSVGMSKFNHFEPLTNNGHLPVFTMSFGSPVLLLRKSSRKTRKPDCGCWLVLLALFNFLALNLANFKTHFRMSILLYYD